jgi:glyoxylase-like metal-dependent hydrolase (beta-lactamase superfamily II)
MLSTISSGIHRLGGERRCWTTGRHGPQITPFTADRAAALASLTRLEAFDAADVLPGHGPVWRDGITAAVAEVRRSEGSAA